MLRKTLRDFRRRLGRPRPRRDGIGWMPFVFFIGLILLTAAVGIAVNRMLEG
jgi:hypothetical protein